MGLLGWAMGQNSFLMEHNLFVLPKLDVAAIVDKAKQQHVEHYSSNTASSLTLYRTLQPE